MTRPLVSVIIPVYNCAEYLAGAIESVLGQDYRPIEVLVIDDGSTDNSAGIAERYSWPVHCCLQPHGGVSAALNRGTDLAQGKLFAFLDADDVWVEGKLTRQVAALERDAALDVVFGHVQQFRVSTGSERSASTAAIPGYLKGTMLIRREAFIRVGKFDTRWRVGDFVDWYLRASDRGVRSLMLPDVVLKRRIHADNLGRRERKHRADFARILKASLDRRRGGAAMGGNVSSGEQQS